MRWGVWLANSRPQCEAPVCPKLLAWESGMHLGFGGKSKKSPPHGKLLATGAGDPELKEAPCRDFNVTLFRNEPRPSIARL